MTQRGAALAEECAASAGELNAQSATLKRAVMELTDLMSAGAGTSAHDQAATLSAGVSPDPDRFVETAPAIPAWSPVEVRAARVGSGDHHFSSRGA